MAFKTCEQKIFEAMQEEYNNAILYNGDFHSAHEGYSVILEEVDELWQEIKKKASERNNEKLYKEALQIATMAMRFIVDICMDDHGNIK